MKTNYVDEAGRILPLIDEMKLKEKEYLFVQSVKARVKCNDYISDKQIYWLRDIKDRQLSSEENSETEEVEE